jgi:hypothetical protein
MVLCYSRLLYVEFSLGTTLWDFLRCHQNALSFFGGVPASCVYDNLSSVVKRRRGTDITLNETFQHFAGHYCFRVHPCWPGASNQKGVVERPMDYVVGNFWHGRHFLDFDDLQSQGRHWLHEIANPRLHATLRQQPVVRFEQERGHLLPLPAEPFDTDWVLYPRVSKDGVVRVDTNDYSIPWQYARSLYKCAWMGVWPPFSVKANRWLATGAVMHATNRFWIVPTTLAFGRAVPRLPLLH